MISPIRWGLFAGLAFRLVVLVDLTAAGDLEQLNILNDRYPRVFFFRAAEQACNERRYPTYESWERQFDRLQGIMGKCLDEECLGRERRNPEFFTRFKRRHPDQVVLLHFNGNARDPRYHTEEYFPGHWIYRKAIGITNDVPAESGPTVIHVENAREFRINTGRYRTSNDDIGLFRIDGNGRHDWDYCEQVQLLDVDRSANTITVKRGCYGTSPLSFEAGKSRAAAHAVEGPWGKTNNLLWFYNFAAHCPKDRHGHACADLLVDDLAGWFGARGKLAAFDGLEFDVMHNQTRGDTDGDGVEDDGVIDGINQYGIGMADFARELRQRMGEGFIIQGDGALGPGGVRSQRAFGILNGIESEGWPNLNDWEMKDWSGGMNRHLFWRDNARRPVFNYVNHKWTESVPGQAGARTHPSVPFSRHRLVFAACQFFDAMTCYSFAPANDPDGRFGVWDEFRLGVENKLGWLGRSEGPAVRLAAQKTDLLGGRGQGPEMAAMISGPVKTEVTPEGVRVTAKDPAADKLRFAIKSVPTNGRQLFLSVEMRGNPRAGYSKEMARFAQVGVSGGNATTDHAQWGDARIKAREGTDGQVTETKQIMTWVNDRFFRSSFYYDHIQPERIEVSFQVEGGEAIVIRQVTAHACPDVVYRIFENGLVLANPSRQPYTFDLARISPGRTYRRIQAAATQDEQTNNGRPVGATVTLGERDGLFLERTKPGTK